MPPLGTDRPSDRRSPARRSPVRRAAPVAAKVPAVGAMFWVAKILTTGMGEAASDYLGSLNLVLAGAVGLAGFVLALRAQLRADRYRAGTYWTAVAMIAVFGTMVADGLHVVVQAPYWSTTLAFTMAVVAVFRLWWRAEGTLSIHSITTASRERYYWLTVLATFALGTAVGDFTASTLHLGFLGSAVLFAVAICGPWLGWRFFGLSPMVAFWAAYVLTRPLGASVADWLGKPHSLTGLDLGDGPVAGIGILLIVAVVAVLARTRSDVQAGPVAVGALGG